MANTNQQQSSQEQAAPAAQKGVPFTKLLLIGIPLFLVQLILVYFVMVKSVGGASTPSTTTDTGHTATGQEGDGEPAQKVMMVKDLIVNPAGTNGTRFLLTTIGFEVSSGEGLKVLESKDLQVRDVLNTILTSKGLDDLVDVSRREDLRAEISRQVSPLLTTGELKHVYFSKFIVQ